MPTPAPDTGVLVRSKSLSCNALGTKAGLLILCAALLPSCMELRMQGEWERLPPEFPVSSEAPRERLVIKGNRMTWIDLDERGSEIKRSGMDFRLVQNPADSDTLILTGANSRPGDGCVAVGISSGLLYFHGPGMPARYRRISK